MAKRIFAKGNYLYFDYETIPIIRYSKRTSLFEKTATEWVIRNTATGGIITILISSVATWFLEDNITEYTAGTLDTAFETHTGA